MSSRISKRKIKKYIEYLKEKLKDLEREGKKMLDENNKTDKLIYDLTDHYLNEENLRGQIRAAYYILNNC